jgi:predicted  nucleic acid-binding Zn-ribbon protein
MNDYNFEFESLNDRIRDLETEVERLKNENIETTNTLYEIMITLDKFNDSGYDLRKFTLGE